VRRSAAPALTAVLIVLAACTSAPAPSPPVEPSNRSASSSIPAGTASPSGPSATTATSAPITTLASGDALPACVPRTPATSDNVTFVALGHAWALSPSGGHLTCLFAVEDAGPFEWGPLGDRALLGGLEVTGVAGGPSLSARDRTFAAIAWSKPTGKSIVYAPIDGKSLKKLHLDGAQTEDVTPIKSSTYLSVTYHPSGEAFAFAARLKDGESIWIAANTGKTVARLVFSTEGTKFGAIGFDVDGRHLLYAAQHADNHAELHRIDMKDSTTAPVIWAGPTGQMVLDIKPGPTTQTVAWTVGTSCADGIAMVQTPAGTVRLLPDATMPTRAVGWLGATQLLVATGTCGALLDLSAVDVSTGSIVPLVSGVSIAAVRTPVPTPPAPLPGSIAAIGSGFS
jgi:hypothetical protein